MSYYQNEWDLLKKEAKNLSQDIFTKRIQELQLKESLFSNGPLKKEPIKEPIKNLEEIPEEQRICKHLQMKTYETPCCGKKIKLICVLFNKETDFESCKQCKKINV